MTPLFSSTQSYLRYYSRAHSLTSTASQFFLPTNIIPTIPFILVYCLALHCIGVVVTLSCLVLLDAIYSTSSSVMVKAVWRTSHRGSQSASVTADWKEVIESEVANMSLTPVI